MNGAKKITTVFDDQLNAKIQRKFDSVFNDKTRTSTSSHSSDESGEELQFGNDNGEDFVMEKSGKNNSDSTKTGATNSVSEINLDFSLDDYEPAPVQKTVSAAKTPEVVKTDDNGLGFSLDFDLDGGFEDKTEAKSELAAVEAETDDSLGFSIDDSDIPGQVDFTEGTKKTVLISATELTNSNLEEFSLEGGYNSSAENMSLEESRANIETTIKDIIRPKNGDTKEIDLTTLDNPSSQLIDINGSLEFRDSTPSKGFDLTSMDTDAFSLDSEPVTKMTKSSDSTAEFDIDSLDKSFLEPEVSVPVKHEPVTPKNVESKIPEPAPKFSPQQESPVSMGLGGSSMTTEDSMRFQGTIRALREEREEMLALIKNLKSDSKELEQDNLTLKANLDEAKIEITILRKRHMVELEDIKYRMTLGEEKKAMAEEKARQADMRREKLEQKVRIDFNQVKQREKELESKLELLSMDVDSQVHSRDQKILELRRKIDALEFNMENASIKEQKSLDDKRKLEDRLNKIMKTLRHSIKNLEDDIDHAQEDDDHQKEKN